MESVKHMSYIYEFWVACTETRVITQCAVIRGEDPGCLQFTIKKPPSELLGSAQPLPRFTGSVILQG